MSIASMNGFDIYEAVTILIEMNLYWSLVKFCGSPVNIDNHPV
jgi:hypothetical protein